MHNNEITYHDLIRIGQPLILLQTWEPNRAIVELTQQLEEKAKATNRKTIIFEWRIAIGLSPFNALAQEIGLPCKPLTQEQKETAKQYGEKAEQKPETFQEPSQLTEMFIFLKSLEAEDDSRQIILFYRLDAFENAKEHFWNNPIVIDHFKHNAELIGSFGSVIFLYHDQFVPQALTKDIMVTEFKLPSKEERAKILQLQKTNLETQTATKIEIDNEPLLVDRLAGMGKLEAENALRLAWHKTNSHAVFDVNTLVEIKSKIISQVPGLSIYEGEESVANLGGFKGVKTLFDQLTAPSIINNPKLMPRSFCFIGPPGCLHGNTKIYDPIDKTNWPIKYRHQLGKPFHVYAMSSNGPVITAAMPPKKYKSAQMIEFTLNNGKTITTTLGHKFWTGSQYATAATVLSHIQKYAFFPLASTSGTFLQAHALNALRWAQKLLNYRKNYSYCHHQYDEPLHVAKETCQVFAQSLNDVVEHKNVTNSNDFTWGTEKINIVSARILSGAPYYDFHVPIYETYWAEGLWHHNSGKSHCAKALCRAKGWPLIQWDIGSSMGKFVGESEHNVDRVFQVIQAQGRCGVFIDEIDKLFSSNEEHEVTARIMGKMLGFLNDNKTGAFIFATANDIIGLVQKRPEFVRAERWDRLFYCDFPSDEEKDEIWKIWGDYYELDLKQKQPNTNCWTGAEIKQCCRYAATLSISLIESAKSIIPIYETGKEQIQAVRKWAEGRCCSATTGLRFSDTRLDLNIERKFAGE